MYFLKILQGIGSILYHQCPNNVTLGIDVIPMQTIALFASYILIKKVYILRMGYLKLYDGIKTMLQYLCHGCKIDCKNICAQDNHDLDPEEAHTSQPMVDVNENKNTQIDMENEDNSSSEVCHQFTTRFFQKKNQLINRK